jgi:hypothetical protein
MAAAGLQNACLTCGNHGRAQIEARYRTPRPLGQIVRDPRDAGRAVETLLDAPGDDPDHAGVPCRTADHQGRVALSGLRLSAAHRIAQNGGLHLLALAIDRIQHGGKRSRLHGVLAQQQPQA